MIELTQAAGALREAFAVGALFGIVVGAVGAVLISELMGGFKR